MCEEFALRVFAEVAERKERLKHRLEARVLALARQAVHLQKALVGFLLDLDQVRDRNGRLDFRKVDALAVDVFRKAVHSVDLEEIKSAFQKAPGFRLQAPGGRSFPRQGQKPEAEAPGR